MALIVASGSGAFFFSYISQHTHYTHSCFIAVSAVDFGFAHHVMVHII